MTIGVPKEIKPDEYRVALLPVGAEELRRKGHRVVVQRGAGEGSGVDDGLYAEHGAEIADGAAAVYAQADLVVKVKEPLPQEYGLLRRGQAVFGYFHFAASRELTEALLGSGIVAIAYETLHTPDGRHPLLTPMSEIAGKMSIQEGAKYLEKPMMGRGILLGGVPGVEPAHVLIVGGGTVGTNAAKVAAGLGAQVTVADIDLERLRYLDDILPANVTTVYSDAHTLREKVREADLVIGAVLVEGAKAPVIVTEAMVRTMQPGAVIVDVSVDQGGCVATTEPTTHRDPIRIKHGVVHYGVTNMPGAVGRTSTYALTHATLPYLLTLAEKGYERAASDSPAIRAALNLVCGKVTNRAVAETFGLPYHAP
ncbi:MAG TPA: alanine dehydrogenase [Planctomycetota bacterium]|nr:alanine dehydrogenase [Planctomycetota bacterium]HRR82106.1 alanine dehydrogenase [Planctomycetota bacterium]HRT96702.1 alanine dehydrogenase [Planctomycetota bacterium]